MPDIAANKPTAGAPIESAWGGEVHDILEALTTGTTKYRLQFGTATVSYVPPSGTQTVNFPVAFAAGSVPLLFVNVNISSAQYYATGHSATNTSFSARVTHRDGAGSNSSVTVDWLAIGPA
jgi:hypothetical protein